MKRKTTISNEDFTAILYMPNKWFEDRSKSLKRTVAILITIFAGIGFWLHQYYVFPFFLSFVIVFACIGLIVCKSIHFYSMYMAKITSSLATQNIARPANSFYYKFVYKNIAYMLFPFMIVIIFGYGGCLMFEAISFDPLFMWVMTLFSLVVYISIVGYVQYILLAVYIYKLAKSKYEFSALQHSLNECIPADIEWIQNITKLSHVYRTVFFTIGGLYIIAFSAFCYIPDFKANCDLQIYHILWGIIFIAIVLTFPVISVLEYLWIKKIVEKIKNKYLFDIQKETKQNVNNFNKDKISKLQIFLLENIYALRIMESRNYPIVSIWNVGYSVCLTIFNFMATILTIVHELPTVLDGLRQML